MHGSFALISLLSKNIPKLHHSHAPHFTFILDFITTQAQASLSTFSFPSLPSLASKPQCHSLEIIAHASLRSGPQFLPMCCHILVENSIFFLHNVEDGQEGSFCRELDGNDGIANRRENGWCEQWNVRSHEIVVGAGDGAEHNKGKTPSVGRVAGRNDWSESLEERFGMVEGLGRFFAKPRSLAYTMEEVKVDLQILATR